MNVGSIERANSPHAGHWKSPNISNTTLASARPRKYSPLEVRCSRTTGRGVLVGAGSVAVGGAGVGGGGGVAVGGGAGLGSGDGAAGGPAHDASSNRTTIALAQRITPRPAYQPNGGRYCESNGQQEVSLTCSSIYSSTSAQKKRACSTIFFRN